MGAVYRATDTRLHRTVAIKLVAPGLSANPESRARFEREGRLLASLNHPNVAAIHGMEEFQGVRALVLEFVEGHTLADVIARAHSSAGSESPRSRPADHEGGVAAGRDGTPRALRMDDALRIARQIALALTAAHDKGIVHRDLKPANIKITPTGDVKVLDFGIAKLAASHDELPIETAATRAAEPTREGTIVGTAAYMSPEQARGQPANKRADIWAYRLCAVRDARRTPRVRRRHVVRYRREGDRARAGLGCTASESARRDPDARPPLPAEEPRRLATGSRRCAVRNCRCVVVAGTRPLRRARATKAVADRHRRCDGCRSPCRVGRVDRQRRPRGWSVWSRFGRVRGHVSRQLHSVGWHCGLP